MNPDDIALNFTPGTLVILNVVLGLIMFGIALDTTVDDFKVVLRKPKPFVIAILAQLIVLPAVTFGLTLILPVTPSMALGMILVACCPPGNISQVLTHRSGGNVALSVSMTAVSNVIYIFALPLSVAFWGSLHPTARTLLEAVELNAWAMLLDIFLIIGLPFAAGLLLRNRFPGFAVRVQPFVKWFSLLALVGFIVAALAGNWAYFVAFLGIIVLVVTIHDAVALAIGYSTAVVGGLGTRERKALTFEVGIRNAGLGLGLVFAFFGGLGGMAIVAGWWGIWDIIAGLVVAAMWARHTRRRTGFDEGRRDAARRPGRRARGGPDLRPVAGPCPMSARVLVTGGAGFLGSYVVAALVTHPGVDLVVAGDVRRPEHPIEGVLYDELDVTRPAGLAPLLERHGIDVVVHLAAIVNPGRDHDLEYRVDVDGTRNVIDACVATGVRRIVVSSSGAAYGYHPDNPDWLHETDPVRGNEEFPYAKHKRLVEEMLAETRRTHPELEQVVFRIGTILGPTVQNQITALWDGRRILAVAGSESPFVFVWVDDVAGAMARAATDGPPGIYNVAGDGRLTVHEIARRLGKPTFTVRPGLLALALRIGRAVRLTVHGPEQVGFLRYRPVLANDALTRDFGFTPAKTSAEAFEAYLEAHPGVARR